MLSCKMLGCTHPTEMNQDFCNECLLIHPAITENKSESLSSKYPKYYKPVGELTEIDVYAVHHLFDIKDPSGCIHHASKKLLLSGVRTGGKSAYKDIKEASDTLTRWLQLNDDTQ